MKIETTNTFAHALRGVIHAVMAATAERVIDEDIDDLTSFERCSVEMMDFWFLHDKYFTDRYVWLPTSGTLPDTEPLLGEDGYLPPDEASRRGGSGVRGRLARLMREHDGDTLH